MLQLILFHQHCINQGTKGYAQNLYVFSFGKCFAVDFFCHLASSEVLFISLGQTN